MSETGGKRASDTLSDVNSAPAVPSRLRRMNLVYRAELGVDIGGVLHRYKLALPPVVLVKAERPLSDCELAGDGESRAANRRQAV